MRLFLRQVQVLRSQNYQKFIYRTFDCLPKQKQTTHTQTEKSQVKKGHAADHEPISTNSPVKEKPQRFSK